MESFFIYAFATSIIAAIVTTAGIFVMRRFEAWGNANTTYFSCFSAGILISVSFLHIIPESIEMSHEAPFYLLGGYMFMYFFNRFVAAYVCHKHSKSNYAIGLTPMFGIAFHSFVDGIVYSITFNASVFTGVLASSGMILHEFSEGVVTYMLLIRSGMSKRTATILAFFAAAITTPLGMLSSYPFISSINDIVLGDMLALSAGMLIYVGATHLLPHAEREHKKYSVAALAAGIIIAIIIMNFSPHGGHAH